MGYFDFLGPLGTGANYVADKVGQAADATVSAYRSYTNAGDPTLDPDGAGQSNYDYSHTTFPPDITNGHYMMININLSKWSTYGAETGMMDDQYSTADRNRASMSGNEGYVARRTRRVAKTICLYMPNTAVFSQANAYEDISLTGIINDGVKLGAGLISSKASGYVGSALSGGAKASQIMGSPINPKTEVLFSNTTLRTFQFDFLFAPTSEAETQILKEMIETLRFHTAPELGNLGGFLWVPPSEFDITFFKDDGAENPNLPKISTCVMENLDVDYAPTGIYSTFSNGYPVSVRLTMRLKEVEVIHKALVKKGF